MGLSSPMKHSFSMCCYLLMFNDANIEVKIAGLNGGVFGNH